MSSVRQMGLVSIGSQQFLAPGLLQLGIKSIDGCNPRSNVSFVKPLVIEAKANTQKENAKVRNRRLQQKFNGTSARPRLSVFCSSKQLYATLIDDQKKKCLFYGSTLQKFIRGNPPCTTIEAAKKVGEELVKACMDFNINEVSYDWNGFARGERMRAFETAISRHGFLPK